MSEITQNSKYPYVMRMQGIGRVEFLEWENDIWIQDIFTEKRGAGTTLIRNFVKYARAVNKNIYGALMPVEHDSMMSMDRLKRWYHLLGAKEVQMIGHPNTMKLEIRK
jgi:hypothetical protein